MNACVRGGEIGYSWPGNTRPVPSRPLLLRGGEMTAAPSDCLFPSFHESNPLVGWFVAKLVGAGRVS
jgi:hypothetical protein